MDVVIHEMSDHLGYPFSLKQIVAGITDYVDYNKSVYIRQNHHIDAAGYVFSVLVTIANHHTYTIVVLHEEKYISIIKRAIKIHLQNFVVQEERTKMSFELDGLYHTIEFQLAIDFTIGQHVSHVIAHLDTNIAMSMVRIVMDGKPLIGIGHMFRDDFDTNIEVYN